MRAKLTALILMVTVPFAVAAIAKIPLKRPHRQALLGFIWMSQTGSGSECTALNPCSEATATAQSGVSVFMFDGVYSFGPRTNAVNPAGCTSTNCVGVWMITIP